MLAITIYVENGRLRCRPRDKLQAVPLATSSSHPWRVHVEWPKHRLRAIDRLCCDDEVSAEKQHSFVETFRAFHAPRWLVEYLNSQVRSEPKRGLVTPGEHRIAKSPIFWLVLPFHAAWRIRDFNRNLGHFLHDSMWNAVVGPLWAHKVPEVRISWKMSRSRFEAWTAA